MTRLVVPVKYLIWNATDFQCCSCL